MRDLTDYIRLDVMTSGSNDNPTYPKQVLTLDDSIDVEIIGRIMASFRWF